MSNEKLYCGCGGSVSTLQSRKYSGIDIECDNCGLVIENFPTKAEAIEAFKTATRQGKIKEAVGLLNATKCPCCDGSGAYYDGYGDVCQCEWCARKEGLIDNLPKKGDTK